MDDNGKKVIQSLQRAINIINCFDEHSLELSLHNISERLDLNINTTRGLVNTLLANGLVIQNSNNTYSIGFFFLQKSALLDKALMGVAKEKSFHFLEYLAEKYNVSSRLQIATALRVFTISTVNPQNSHYLITSSQATPFPLHATASGKIFLAYHQKMVPSLNLIKLSEKTLTCRNTLRAQLDEILEKGYALEAEESGLGISSVAVPILIRDKGLFGTISITALTPILHEIWEQATLEMQAYASVLADEIFAATDMP